MKFGSHLLATVTRNEMTFVLPLCICNRRSYGFVLNSIDSLPHDVVFNALFCPERRWWFRISICLNSPPGRCIPSPDLMSLDVLRILSYMPHRRKLILSAPGEVLDLTWTRGWCYVACSKFSKKLQSTVSAFECVRCSNVADDTAEGAFVCFDGVMARLHKLRASEASQMLTEGVNPEDSKVPMFIIDMEGKVSTYNFTAHHQTFTITRILKEHERVPVPDFVVDGGTDGDDADLPDGSPVPVESEAGDDSSDAAVSADAKPANDATRKRTRASTKAVKKARVV
ncbi:PREDICTED: uncharacterized protein LOC106340236 isoform X2 [Brassica oleracea var. oleracea]|uniref:uncharacterized protein LOC106340236 isoform X2 n=1 Tax=Brassica oleracea var. oleracea TaxID=109376 RepID=UPI0006A712CD|nr:PREDICTED: uncharacterized protein LOC106340236 isoform X2 [Brassica oleracea var. oleracea]